MKVLIDARFLGTPTGIGRYVEELVVGLEKSLSLPIPPFLKGVGGILEKGEKSLLLPLEKGEEIEVVVLVSKAGWEKWKPMPLSSEQGSSGKRLTNSAALEFKKKLVDVRWYTLLEQFALWRVLREEKPDLVHFPHWNICYFWRGPFVVTIHDLILLEYPTRRASKLGSIAYWLKYKILFPLVLRKAICKSKKIIAPSDYTKQSILKYFPAVGAGKIEVIYEGVAGIRNKESRITDKEFENIKSKIGNWKLEIGNYLLYAGNALPHKNLEFLVRVFKKLKAEHPHLNPPPFKGGGEEGDLKLVLVGEPSYFDDRLKEYVKNSGMYDDVIFTGRVSDDELGELYKSARAYVFPSLLEGFGLPPLEAMAHGAPVVAANSSCLPEILGDAAIYFDPKDEDDALNALKKCLTNEALRENLRIKGFDQIKQYSWEKQAEETAAIYKFFVEAKLMP